MSLRPHTSQFGDAKLICTGVPRILSVGVEAASADNADVAQLAEQLFCKQPVAGSSPIVGSGGVFFASAWFWAVARVDNWAWL